MFRLFYTSLDSLMKNYSDDIQKKEYASSVRNNDVIIPCNQRQLHKHHENRMHELNQMIKELNYDDVI